MTNPPQLYHRDFVLHNNSARFFNLKYSNTGNKLDPGQNTGIALGSFPNLRGSFASVRMSCCPELLPCDNQRPGHMTPDDSSFEH